MRPPILRILLLGMILCATVAFWAAMAGFTAKQCLDGGLNVQQDSDWRGAMITEEGCEVTTASGEVVLVPISGPPFGVGVASALGFAALGTLGLVVLVRRRERRPVVPVDVG
jgi:hypothetical protein